GSPSRGRGRTATVAGRPYPETSRGTHPRCTPNGRAPGRRGARSPPAAARPRRAVGPGRLAPGTRQRPGPLRLEKGERASFGTRPGVRRPFGVRRFIAALGPRKAAMNRRTPNDIAWLLLLQHDLDVLVRPLGQLDLGGAVGVAFRERGHGRVRVGQHLAGAE